MCGLAGLVFDKATMLRDMIKGTLYGSFDVLFMEGPMYVRGLEL